ncbi:MAG: hypothetical protein U0W40_16085 [Acidimicrobiia bacterium]
MRTPSHASCATGCAHRDSGGDEIEFQHEYAALVPSMVASRLSVPDELTPEFRRLTWCFLEITDGAEFVQRGRHLPRCSPTCSRSDGAWRPFAAEIDGERLPDDELLGFCMLLILAGNDTTSSLIERLRAARRFPELRHRARRPVSSGATDEEMVRLESPAQTLPRNTTVDVELHGETIRPEPALVWASANRDEREFERPDEVVLDRPAGRHLAFGHGAHFCSRPTWPGWRPGRRSRRSRRRSPTPLACTRTRQLIWARAHARIPVALR